MINEFVEKHKEWLNTKSHYGLFIWKPYIILKTLENMNENDIMVYSDAGMHLNVKGKNKFYEYLENMKKNCKDLKDLQFFWNLLEDMPFHCRRDRP